MNKILDLEQLKDEQRGSVTDCYDSFRFQEKTDLFNDECAVNHVYDEQSYAMHLKIIEGLRSIYDPEIALNIYDLGLIYGIDSVTDQTIGIQMTLTSANCPAAESMPEQIKSLIYHLTQRPVNIVLYWSPPWDAQRVSAAGKLELGIME